MNFEGSLLNGTQSIEQKLFSVYRMTFYILIPKSIRVTRRRPVAFSEMVLKYGFSVIEWKLLSSYSSVDLITTYPKNHRAV